MRGSICLVSLLLWRSCTAAEPAASPHREQPPVNAVITLQRGACEKRCSVYKLAIFADGTLLYDGQSYVRKTGPVAATIPTSEVVRLVADFQAANYFAMKSQYGYDGVADCSSVESDAPVAITSVTAGSQSKSVIHHHRCRGAVPDQLTRLEDELDKAANTRRWIK